MLPLNCVFKLHLQSQSRRGCVKMQMPPSCIVFTVVLKALDQTGSDHVFFTSLPVLYSSWLAMMTMHRRQQTVVN